MDSKIMDASAIRYAEALFNVAEEQKLEEFVKDFSDLHKALLTNHLFEKMFTSPRILKEEKKEIIKKIFSINSNENFKLLSNLFCLLIDKKRESLFLKLYEAFMQIYRKKTNTVLVRLTLARDVEIAKLLPMVKNIIVKRARDFAIDNVENIKVIIVKNITNKIIGSYIFRVGDYMLDASYQRILKDWAWSSKKTAVLRG